jgi:hypothetical protein
MAPGERQSVDEDYEAQWQRHQPEAILGEEIAIAILILDTDLAEDRHAIDNPDPDAKKPPGKPSGAVGVPSA